MPLSHLHYLVKLVFRTTRRVVMFVKWAGLAWGRIEPQKNPEQLAWNKQLRDRDNPSPVHFTTVTTQRVRRNKV